MIYPEKYTLICSRIEAICAYTEFSSVKKREIIYF